ncbi:MAG: TPM domain-containing protein [Pigmentiphaga sp.]|nr:TPM domain-containing protein [Pigmentiphaga sp.]
MKISRFFKHLLTSSALTSKTFNAEVLDAIEAEIKAGETTHHGDIRFVIEPALEPLDLLQGRTPRERAIELFSQLRVWDTEYNNGVLFYVLMAERSVEFVCDRGLRRRTTQQQWIDICNRVDEAYQQGKFLAGSLAAIQEINQILAAAYPEPDQINQLEDRPLIL